MQDGGQIQIQSYSGIAVAFTLVVQACNLFMATRREGKQLAILPQLAPGTGAAEQSNPKGLRLPPAASLSDACSSES